MGFIQNGTAFMTYPDMKAIAEYKRICMDMLHFNFPLLSPGELSAAIDWSIANHFKDTPVVVDNNYTHKQINSTLSYMANYIMDKEPIITSYGVLFKRHGTVPNPLYGMIDGFINDRKAMKKEMFKYPKGSEDFEKYNLLQLLLKIDANGFYGATGLYSCIFYNLYTASSVTTQGRSCNSAAALFLESFLNNNVPMSSMNELIEFIHSVLNEEHHYDSSEIIDIHASLEETFFQLLSSTGYGWIPSEDEMHIVWEILSKLSQDELDRLFYKNNLYHFIDNQAVSQAILFILQSLESPFMDPNEPPENIIEPLKALTDILYEYVYYNKQIIDRLAKMDSLVRSVSIIQDTDSAIVSFDGFYQYVRQMCHGIPMKIKTQNVDAATYLDDGEVKTEPVIGKITEYSFVDDDMIEMDRLVDPMVIIPQDGLRYSIINLLAYCVGILLNDYMDRYCKNSHSENERACLITMKNEFLFKRVLLSSHAKKHYAYKVELQEGNQVPDAKSIDAKGMEVFVKSTVNPTIQANLRRILAEDILNVESVDPIAVLRALAKEEKKIYQSIQQGEKKFFKPLKVKSISAYENPMRIQGIKASQAYNYLHEPGTEALDMSIRNSVDVAKVEINPKNIDRIRDSHPYVYEKALELMKQPEYATGIDAVAIPLNEPVPTWILPFVNYDEIINNNLKGFPIESIGIYRGSSTNNATNMIQF